MSVQNRPNIIVYQTDDHAQWALPCYGNSELNTPTFNHLCERGVRMANAFTPTAVCSPARACLLTGRLPSQHGVHDWIWEFREYNDHPGIDGQTNIAQLMQQAGYHTGLVGKWHLGHSERPREGFDSWFSFQVSQYPHFGTQTFSDQGDPVEPHGHQSLLLTDQVIRFLRERPKDKPFFLVVNYVNTHAPFIQQPPRLVDHYRKCSFADIPDEPFPEVHGQRKSKWPGGVNGPERIVGDSGRDAHVKDLDPEEKGREIRAQYYAAVSYIDEQIGRIIDELDGQAVLDDTLTAYTADHGLMLGQHGLTNKANATMPQNFLEEAIRVPCLLHWPNGLPAGAVHDEQVDTLDLYATLLDAAGATPGEPLRSEINSPGESYLPLLQGERGQPWRPYFFSEYGPARMVRRHDGLKYIHRYPGPNGHFGDELYDLRSDPREHHNIIDAPERQDDVVELRKVLEDHFSRYETEQYTVRRMDEQEPCNGNEVWTQPVPSPSAAK